MRKRGEPKVLTCTVRLVSQLFVALAMLAGNGCSAADRVPAFPGAEGFGAYTIGGRGGKVFLVTNLNDSGPGSLREACDAEGPRIVVFRVGGVIELKSRIRIENPFITIAGQTAPGDGICLKNHPFQITETHDVIVRYLRVRPGDEVPEEMDAIAVTGCEDVIIDHCSTSWSNDETLSVTRDPDRITVQWCMITESLNRSHHRKGAHGYGSLISGEQGGVTYHHNVYAHHNSRNPRPTADADEYGFILDFRNNIIYDWGSTAGYNHGECLQMNYVGNYLKSGPSTQDDEYGTAFKVGGAATRMFLADNYIHGFPDKNRDNWLMMRLPQDLTDAEVRSLNAPQPFAAGPIETDPVQTAYQRVLESAGATLPTRDAVDARTVEEIKTGRGKIIDSQAEVGGWPQYKGGPAPADTDKDGMPDEWEKKHGLDAADASDNNKDADLDGDTNIEEYLNGTDPRVAERA